MAVPFNIPEDQNEVEVIINQLQALLTKLQAALRRSRVVTPQQLQAQPTTSTRVRQSGSSRSSRAHDEEVSTSTSSNSNLSQLSSNIPDLLNNLAWLAAASHEAVTTNASIVRSPRRRTSSESSNCEETKISITAIVNHGTSHEWNQDGDSLISPQQRKFFSTDGFLSKFVPGAVSAPLWTAMICFVGWHLFRAR